MTGEDRRHRRKERTTRTTRDKLESWPWPGQLMSQHLSNKLKLIIFCDYKMYNRQYTFVITVFVLHENLWFSFSDVIITFTFKLELLKQLRLRNRLKGWHLLTLTNRTRSSSRNVKDTWTIKWYLHWLILDTEKHVQACEVLYLVNISQKNRISTAGRQ